MKLAIDLDEVLGDFLSAYLAFYNEQHNTKWHRDQFHSYYFWDVMGGTADRHRIFSEQFWDTQHFANMQPREDALTAVRTLAHDHTLVLITARPHVIEHRTIAWLQQHFPNAFSKVHHTNQFSRFGAWRSKAEICVEEHIDLMIEDHIENARQCAAVNVPVLLLDAPWNKSPSLPDKITRVFSWHEILTHLRDQTF